MAYQMGNCYFEAEGHYLTLALPDSGDIFDDTKALRARMRRDGYLLLRGLHDADDVLDARHDILQIMSTEGALDPDAPVMDGVVARGAHQHASASVRGRERLKTDSLARVVGGPRIMAFFDRFLGARSLSYNFQWLRTAGPGAGSTIHYDVVYMGRGTRDVYTCWTPIGTITPEMGPLALCLGSNTWQHVIDTYGKTDVDRDLTCGYFSNDPAELVDTFGGRWATTTFEPGDVVILSMFLMHASLANNSNRIESVATRAISLLVNRSTIAGPVSTRPCTRRSGSRPHRSSQSRCPAASGACDRLTPLRTPEQVVDRATYVAVHRAHHVRE